MGLQVLFVNAWHNSSKSNKINAVDFCSYVNLPSYREKQRPIDPTFSHSANVHEPLQSYHSYLRTVFPFFVEKYRSPHVTAKPLSPLMYGIYLLPYTEILIGAIAEACILEMEGVKCVEIVKKSKFILAIKEYYRPLLLYVCTQGLSDDILSRGKASGQFPYNCTYHIAFVIKVLKITYIVSKMHSIKHQIEVNFI